MDAFWAGAATGFALLLFKDAKRRGIQLGPGGLRLGAMPTANLPGSPVLPPANCVGINPCGCSGKPPIVPPPSSSEPIQNLTPGVTNTGITPGAINPVQWYYNPAGTYVGATAAIGYNPIQYPMSPTFYGSRVVIGG